jgi:hypothetical protein
VSLVELAGWHPLVAATTGYLGGGVCSTSSARCGSSRRRRNVSLGFVAFTILSLVGLVITWAVMAGLDDGLHVNYVVAKVVAFGLAFAWNFLSRKYLLFRPSADAHRYSSRTGLKMSMPARADPADDAVPHVAGNDVHVAGLRRLLLAADPEHRPTRAPSPTCRADARAPRPRRGSG